MANDNTTFPSVERRGVTRHRANSRVAIRTRDGKYRFTTAVNLSATGVAVKTSDMGLAKNTSVDLVFAIRLGGVVKLHRRKARVAYVRNGITGFAMHAYDPGHRYAPGQETA